MAMLFIGIVRGHGRHGYRGKVQSDGDAQVARDPQKYIRASDTIRTVHHANQG